MKLTANTIGQIAERIYTPAGTYTGDEFSEEFGKKNMQTTLSVYGYNTLRGDYDYEDSVERERSAPKSFHVLVEGWGWCQAITEMW